MSQSVVILNIHALASAFLTLLNSVDEDPSLTDIIWDGETVNISDIRTLVIANCRIKEVALSDGVIMDLLSFVNVSFNKLTEANFLRNMNGLIHLDISHNKLSSLKSLQGTCHHLRTLRINNNEIDSLSSLSHINNLTEFWCNCNLVPWQEFYYVQCFPSLSTIVLYENPATEKDGFYSFLYGCCNTLTRIDYHDIASISANPSKIAPLGSLNINTSIDFLRSASGRVMLTQARAILSSNGQVSIPVANIPEPHSLSPVDSTASNSNLHGNNFSRKEKSVKQIVTRTSHSGSGVHTKDNKPGVSNRRPFSESESLVGKVTTFKATKSQADGVMDMLDTNDDDGEIMADEYHSPVMNKKRGMVLPQYPQTPKFIPDGGVNSIPEERSNTQRIIHFGEANTSAISCYLDDNGNGYTKWNKHGMLACSLTDGKIIASYKQGGVAVVYDMETLTGSLMDPKGQNVLLLSCAVPMNQSDPDAEPIPTAKIMNPHNGTIKQIITKSGEVNHTGFGNKLSWNYDGLVIAFDPLHWELLITVDNTRTVTKFSSTRGVTIVQENKSVVDKVRALTFAVHESIHTYNEDHQIAQPGSNTQANEPSSQPLSARNGGNIIHSGAGDTKLTNSMRDQISHDNIHHGVSSIMSQLSELDSMMSKKSISSNQKKKKHV